MVYRAQDSLHSFLVSGRRGIFRQSNIFKNIGRAISCSDHQIITISNKLWSCKRNISPGLETREYHGKFKEPRINCNC